MTRTEFLANKNTQEPQRRGSLSDSKELDLISHLNLKSRSDTLLNDDGNANRAKSHNLVNKKLQYRIASQAFY